jgi:glycosyltransferase involved in cell wall biosynthesis
VTDIKVVMHPDPYGFGEHESGIRRVVEAYARYLPDYGVQVLGSKTDVGKSYDLVAVHAGTAPGAGLSVAHCHGLYWTADYPSEQWAWRANNHVIDGIRRARKVTVPSNWVAETIERDMRFSPTVIGHGLEWEQWQSDTSFRDYVLWNKNRAGVDVCDPYPVTDLAMKFGAVPFISTFSRPNPPRNVTVTGLLEHRKMMDLVKNCRVYLSSTKETFGIGILEAMAAGKPILGFSQGGVLDLVQHGVNGYLAEPGNYDDLADGLQFCMKHDRILGTNSRELSKSYTWPKMVEKVAGVYRAAIKDEPAAVDVVIPVFNKAPDELKRAINSVLGQTDYLKEVIVVNDGSEQGLSDQYRAICGELDARYLEKENGGVATARNFGIEAGNSKYILCLDADDAIEPQYLEACVPPLEEDSSIGISFTKLWYIKPDGEEGISPWPDGFDYDAQLRRRNQIPTACVFRREMWDRLGGYKQRDAVMATEAPLFKYSWLSGIVTGNPEYRQVDYMAWHPWVDDGQHPMASMATPKKMSHAVRQYDEPTISVVIPVGPGHGHLVDTALDSLESQTMRKWEAIVVYDDGEGPSDRLIRAYPYARFYETGMIGVGAGAARNLGAKHARAPMLAFLDADDLLLPEALEKMLEYWEKYGDGVYTDYLGRSTVDDPSKLADDIRNRIISYENGEAVIKYKSHEFDCTKAALQPENPPYVWNLITTLIPIAWHDEIGGFDEGMASWEDVDYWWRMAWSGKCFRRLPERLMVYKFYSGTRRDEGVRNWDYLLKYMGLKKESIEIMPCGCKQDKGNGAASAPMAAALVAGGTSMQDEDIVMIEYVHPNKGQHSVKGAATGENYGYRAKGDRFLVHRKDIALQPHIFQVVRSAPRAEERQVPAENLPEPTPISTPPIAVVRSDGLDLALVPGVTPAIAERFTSEGLTSKDKILDAGVDGLVAIKGIGETRAMAILSYLSSDG